MTMQGTERQVAWANDIKATYELMYKRYFDETKPTGTPREIDRINGERKAAKGLMLYLTGIDSLKLEHYQDSLKEEYGASLDDWKRIKAAGKQADDLAKYHAAIKRAKADTKKWFKKQIDQAMANADATFWINKRL